MGEEFPRYRNPLKKAGKKHTELKEEGHARFNGLVSFTLDHVLRNTARQDVASVCAILEAVLIHTKLEVPEVTEVSFVFDNASYYTSDIFRCMLPLIGDRYGMHIRTIIHPEAQHGKGLCDSHFAVGMMLILSYVVDEGFDYATPKRLVTASQSNGGVINSSSEMLCQKNSVDVSLWRDALRSGDVHKLGRNSQVIYNNIGRGEFLMSAFEY